MRIYIDFSCNINYFSIAIYIIPAKILDKLITAELKFTCIYF